MRPSASEIWASKINDSGWRGPIPGYGWAFAAAEITAVATAGGHWGLAVRKTAVCERCIQTSWRDFRDMTFGHRRASAIFALVKNRIFRRFGVLHKCANSNCTNRFRQLSQGKLFLVDTEPVAGPARRRARSRPQPAHRVEYYWLCEQCAFVLTLSYEKGRGVIAVPRPEPARKMPVAAVSVVETPNRASNRTEQSA